MFGILSLKSDWVKDFSWNKSIFITKHSVPFTDDDDDDYDDDDDDVMMMMMMMIIVCENEMKDWYRIPNVKMCMFDNVCIGTLIVVGHYVLLVS